MTALLFTFTSLCVLACCCSCCSCLSVQLMKRALCCLPAYPNNINGPSALFFFFSLSLTFNSVCGCIWSLQNYDIISVLLVFLCFLWKLCLCVWQSHSWVCFCECLGEFSETSGPQIFFYLEMQVSFMFGCVHENLNSSPSLFLLVYSCCSQWWPVHL